MDFFPSKCATMRQWFLAPFTLGTSPARATDVIPATVSQDPHNPEKATVPTIIAEGNNESEPVKSLRSNQENRTQLAQAFGSAKKQRWLRELERTAEHRDAITDTVVINRVMSAQKRLRTDAETAKAEASDSRALKPEEDQPVGDLRLSLLPPYRLHATQPQDVYPLDQALPPSRVLHALEAEVERLASHSHSSLTEAGVYQRCVLNRHLPASATAASASLVGNSRHRLMQCLVVVSHMMALFKLTERQVQRKKPLPDTPDAVAVHLVKEFTATIRRSDSGFRNARFITPTLRDRLIYHILVIILHCDNFKTYFDDLAVDFGMPCDKLRRYFVYLGCKVAKEDIKTEDGRTTRFRATLTAPVNFPDAMLSKRRRY